MNHASKRWFNSMMRNKLFNSINENQDVTYSVLEGLCSSSWCLPLLAWPFLLNQSITKSSFSRPILLSNSLARGEFTNMYYHGVTVSGCPGVQWRLETLPTRWRLLINWALAGLRGCGLCADTPPHCGRQTDSVRETSPHTPNITSHSPSNYSTDTLQSPTLLSHTRVSSCQNYSAARNEWNLI